MAKLDSQRVDPIYEKLTGHRSIHRSWNVERRNLAQKIVYIEEACRAVLSAIADIPFWQAARPSPRPMCVLPVPLLPTAMMFSRRVTRTSFVRSYRPPIKRITRGKSRGRIRFLRTQADEPGAFRGRRRRPWLRCRKGLMASSVMGMLLS